MRCDAHGSASPVIACRHVRDGGSLRLFVVPADAEFPLQVWCDACERARVQDKGWHEHADTVADWAYLCGGCYGQAASRALSIDELPAIETPETR